jgi:hypothetical protein
MIGLRKLHRILGVWIAVLVVLQVLGGMLLRLGVTSSLVFNFHTWFKFVQTKALAVPGAVIAIVLGLSLGTQAVSGVIMYVNLKVQQAKRKAKLKASPPPRPAPPAA